MTSDNRQKSVRNSSETVVDCDEGCAIMKSSGGFEDPPRRAKLEERMKITMRCASILTAVAWTAVVVMVGPSAHVSVATAGLQQKGGAAAKNPIPVSENSIKAGRAVYAKICRACHGLQGKGDGVSAPPGSKPANLVDTEWKYGSTDGEIFKTIKEGVKPFDVMEPWGKKISDTDIWNTINYLRDLGKRAKK
jgi:mono/diheme cytochrome c family protein